MNKFIKKNWMYLLAAGALYYWYMRPTVPVVSPTIPPAA
jgi:hypothetical protein